MLSQNCCASVTNTFPDSLDRYLLVWKGATRKLSERSVTHTKNSHHSHQYACDAKGDWPWSPNFSRTCCWKWLSVCTAVHTAQQKVLVSIQSHSTTTETASQPPSPHSPACILIDKQHPTGSQAINWLHLIILWTFPKHSLKDCPDAREQAWWSGT